MSRGSGVLCLAWGGGRSKGGGAPLPPGAARPVARQGNSSPHPADEHLLLGGRPGVGGSRDHHAPAGPISAGIRRSVIITVDRPGDVDELASQARAAGATVTKEPTDAEFFEGRDAY
jgi:hypothetical protein